LARFVLADLPVVFLFISSNARVFDALHDDETDLTNKPVYMPNARLIMTDALSSPSYSDQLPPCETLAQRTWSKIVLSALTNQHWKTLISIRQSHLSIFAF
jgi:hypothetical protein